jgi:hypothetical protein
MRAGVELDRGETSLAELLDHEISVARFAKTRSISGMT